MEKKLKTLEQSVSEDIKDLVIARLEVLPANKRISIGSSGEFDRDELVQHVKDGDDIGQKITELELTFLRALKEGTLLEERYREVNT